jgi:hypothetical protein
VIKTTQIAEYLGCVTVVSKPVEVTLIRQGQTFYNYIRKAPHSWAIMGCRIESESIFKEAVIHLAGNWTVFSKDDDMQEALSNYGDIVAVVEKHHELLNKKRTNLELAGEIVYLPCIGKH